MQSLPVHQFSLRVAAERLPAHFGMPSVATRASTPDDILVTTPSSPILLTTTRSDSSGPRRWFSSGFRATQCQPPRSAWHRRGAMAQDAGLVVLSALFFYVNARQVIVAHSFTSVFFAAEQGVLVVVFLTRRRSTVTSTRVRDWVFATIGGWLPLVLRPGGVTIPPLSSRALPCRWLLSA